MPRQKTSPIAPVTVRCANSHESKLKAHSRQKSRSNSNWFQVLTLCHRVKTAHPGLQHATLHLCFSWTSFDCLTKRVQHVGWYAYLQVLVLCWTHCVIGWGFFIFQSWMPSYLHSVGAADLGSMGMLSALPWAVISSQQCLSISPGAAAGRMDSPAAVHCLDA